MYSGLVASFEATIFYKKLKNKKSNFNISFNYIYEGYII